MRYLDWDVLLFPGNSRVPLQEFDTKCHVLSDQNNRFIDNAVLNSNLYLSEIDSMSQIPMLTTFIPSLEHGSAFRVSVHSWESPKASQILRTFKTHQETIAYEARVYIDGNMVAQRLFDDQTIWPEVVESAGNSNSVHTKPLRFPAFHSEILDQAHWEPSETYGRIKVVLAEGVTRQDANSRLISTFDRLRDVIAFSFQHAPKHVLEYSGIAWPNARLFRRGQRAQNNIASRVTTVVDFEAHAHSPHRKRATGSYTTVSESDYAALVNANKLPKESRESEDPFVDSVPTSFRTKRQELRKSSNDVSMKDYNSVGTARSHTGTEMSGISYAKPNFKRSMREAAIEEIVEALSPEKRYDLLTALSPSKTSGNGMERLAGNHTSTRKVNSEARQEQHSGTPLAGFTKTDEGQQRSALRGNLLASKFASAPLLTPSNTMLKRQDLSHGLRSSADPLLPAGWNYTIPKVGDNGLGSVRALLELRPRSTSNSSKRKRQESPRVDTPTAPFKVPSMSTSPCKQMTTTPVQSNCETPSEGGVALREQE